MGPVLVVLGDPRIKVGLQLVDRAVDLFAERHAVELIQDGAMEALADSICLRALGLGAAVVDVLDCEIELVFMALGAAKLSAAIGQHPRQSDAVLVVERHHPVVEDLGGGDRGLAIIQFSKGDLGIGVDHGLLIDPADTLQGADIEGVLGAAIAGAFALELAVRLLVRLGLLKGGDLGFGQQDAILCHLGFERLEAVFDRRQIVALPHAAHPGRRDRQALPLQSLRYPDLAPGRLLDRQVDHRPFDLRRRAVLQDWLASADLLQRQLAAFVVELLKAVKAVAAVAHHLAGLADIAELLGQLQQTELGSDDLLLLCHRGLPHAGGRAAVPARVRTAPRPPAPLRKTNNECQIKFKLLHFSSGSASRGGAGSSTRRRRSLATGNGAFLAANAALWRCAVVLQYGAQRAKLPYLCQVLDISPEPPSPQRAPVGQDLDPQRSFDK